jgi:2-dehydropantoate 2-reductase
MTSPLRVGVMGAGAIGVYVGGRLAGVGCDVTLVGRGRVLDPIALRGLVLEDLEGPRVTLPAGRVRCAEDAAALGDAEVVLLTTKAAGTWAAAEALAAATPAHVPVVSIQNGVDGPKHLRDVLGLRRGYGGMIACNVIFSDATTLRRTTSGPIVIERRSAADEAATRGAVGRLVDALARTGLPTRASREIDRVLWSKLLLNLNNALNALSGLTLQAELRDRGYRRVLAAMQGEGLAVMRALGIRPVRVGAVYPPLARRVLPMPTFVFEQLARTMLRVDPSARSSMADDLALGRPTEVDALNGAIVRHGAKLGVATPINARIVDRVHEAEARGERRPSIAADALLA